MADYVISCCSTADLTHEHFVQRDIQYICFHFALDGVDFPDDLGRSIAFPDFYKAMADGAETRTSQVNVSEFEEYFSRFAAEGKDVLHVTLSSGISGVINSAQSAAEIVMEKYPGRKVVIVDSLGASSGYGLFMDGLADQRDAGMPFDEICAWAEAHRLNLHHWFFSTTLALLNMDDLGHLVPREKIRGKKKVIKTIVDRMAEHAEGGENYSGKCYISNSNCYEDARAVADLIEARFPNLNGRVEINWVGTTIGSHTGPGTVALFFWGDERTR